MFSNTFSPFSINLEPKGGMLLLFWCLLKLLAVVDHSQMSFEETSSLVNVHWTNTIPVPGWYDNISENCSITFQQCWLLFGYCVDFFVKTYPSSFFLSVSPHIYSLYVIWTCVLHVDKGKRSNLKVRTCEDKWTVSYCISSMYRKIRSSETTSKGSI